MPIQGGFEPTTTVDDATVGTISWTNPNNVQSSDGVFATAVNVTSAALGHYVKCTGFGFAIPTGATISGIVMSHVSKVSSIAQLSGGLDNSIKLVQGGTITGNDNASGTFYTTALVNYNRGTSTDLWGLTWLPSDINLSTFGVAYSCKGRNATARTVSTDVVYITVYYVSAGVNYLQQKQALRPAPFKPGIAR